MEYQLDLRMDCNSTEVVHYGIQSVVSDSTAWIACAYSRPSMCFVPASSVSKSRSQVVDIALNGNGKGTVSPR